MIDDDFINDDQDGLALARWPAAVNAIHDALSNADHEIYVSLSRILEVELGLRAVVDRKINKPLDIEEWVARFIDYEANHGKALYLVVPRIERALASVPNRWLRYVDEMGRSCFDPVELAACAAVAKRFSDEPLAEVHVKINAIIIWAWDCLLGQRPIPQIRQLPRRDHPNLMLLIIRAIHEVELNWTAIGLRPIITDDLTVRWGESGTWTAWVKLVHINSNKLNSHAVLRLQSNNFWRILRPAQ